ncbi:MAG TPA: heme-binding domain-containing protein [Candidatus Binataceae bacterium]|nr:heme-binding domain-containing protein [Candidatus Binataceae bacterium]
MGRIKIAAATVLLTASFPATMLLAGASGVPTPTSVLQTSAPVQAILERACYDCHSDRTRWPWYSAVAPLSWLIERDVRLGRQQLNFSRWGGYSSATRRHKLEWIGRVVHSGRMPPRSYVFMHPEAALNPPQRAQIERWVNSALLAEPAN